MRKGECLNKAYLNVGGTESCDAGDLRSRNSRWLEVEHGLQDAVQLRYGGRHVGLDYESSNQLSSS